MMKAKASEGERVAEQIIHSPPRPGVNGVPVRALSLYRVLPLLGPVAALGIVVAAFAAVTVYFQGIGPSLVAGLLALTAAATITEAYPVPMESLPAGQVSLAAVFVVGAAVVYGWAEATVVAYGSRTALELIQRRPPAHLLYNGPVYALSAAAAGGAAAATDASTSTVALAVDVLAASTAFYVVNVLLVTGMMALASSRPFRPLLAIAAVRTIVPFAIMASSALVLAVLWERQPLLALALVGPLLAIALYQRTMHRALVATRLALTDSLTGLGNQRHFHERLQQELDVAAATGSSLALCILDVDGLKVVNDTHGHPVGDRLLENVAACLRHGGEAFRVGGDEFAVLLPKRDVAEATETAKAILERVAAVEVADTFEDRVRISAGIAVFPTHCRERNDLFRCADEALYRSKRSGGNDVVVYSSTQPPDVERLPA
jgi:diguanylate cyclase (GGDEF)-like protein